MRLKRHLIPAAAMAVVALLIVVVPEVSAQDSNYGLGTAAGIAKIPTGTNIPVIIGNILSIALRFVGTLFLLLMVYAGFLWMTARGDSKKVDQAKQLIVGAIIGVVIIAAAYAITNFVLFAATSAGQEQAAAPADIPDGSVATGGTCVGSEDCSAATDICENKKCVTTIESP